MVRSERSESTTVVETTLVEDADPRAADPRAADRSEIPVLPIKESAEPNQRRGTKRRRPDAKTLESCYDYRIRLWLNSMLEPADGVLLEPADSEPQRGEDRGVEHLSLERCGSRLLNAPGHIAAAAAAAFSLFSSCFSFSSSSPL